MMEYRSLGRTGMRVSRLSFGASSLGGAFHPVTIRQCVETVHVALRGGINFVDVSPAYGETLGETNLGIALKGIERSSYYLATKVGSYGETRGDYDYSEARTRQSVESSLKRLGTDYLDLLQCHDIEFADRKMILDETVPTLLALKREGMIRHVGITGLPLGVFSVILDHAPTGTIETILSFCHYNLQNTALTGLLPRLAQENIGVINASPTGMGLLTDAGPPPWHPANDMIKAGCQRAVSHCRERGLDIAALAIQFACENPAITTTLVGTADPEIMRRNLACLDAPYDEKTIAEVQTVLAPIRNNNFPRGRPENRDPLVASLHQFRS